jgi:hypothetical protein
VISSPRVDHHENSDIKGVWAYQYARRIGSVAARLALVSLIGIIKDRSGAADAAQTAAAAERYGIPSDEWNQFQSEL